MTRADRAMLPVADRRTKPGAFYRLDQIGVLAPRRIVLNARFLGFETHLDLPHTRCGLKRALHARNTTASCHAGDVDGHFAHPLLSARSGGRGGWGCCRRRHRGDGSPLLCGGPRGGGVLIGAAGRDGEQKQR